MRRLLAALALVALFARPASAEAPPVPDPRAQAASAEASYLLAAYMVALSRAGMPPSPSDIDEATRQYLTNGAAVTAVPTTGPAAAYFQNGASVTAAPSSGPGAAYFHDGTRLLAYTPTPTAPSTPSDSTAAEAVVDAAPGAEDDAGALDAADEAGPLEPATPLGQATPAPPVAAEDGATSTETASTTQGPTPAAAPTFGGWHPPDATSGTTSTLAASETRGMPWCPPGPSPLGRVATALGGALLGGLAVLLWTLPRKVTLRTSPRSARPTDRT